MDIESFCEKLESRLASLAELDDRVKLTAETLNKGFAVAASEVSILLFDRNLVVLQFLWPPKLAGSGFLPLSARDSTAARAGRDFTRHDLGILMRIARVFGRIFESAGFPIRPAEAAARPYRFHPPCR